MMEKIIGTDGYRNLPAKCDSCQVMKTKAEVCWSLSNLTSNPFYKDKLFCHGCYQLLADALPISTVQHPWYKDFNGRTWAKEFLKRASIKVDEDIMTTWFTAALMAGYDQCLMIVGNPANKIPEPEISYKLGINECAIEGCKQEATVTRYVLGKTRFVCEEHRNCKVFV